ncbi:hypothetical protein CPB84DRAFT_1751259 [Gymnopilus junonius]|uniref:Glutamine amidotransferase type-2 domain-containing protein n=1 Tax=Gymnopilus junonius TaxID=109634 RepID=A0A9P5NET2_GYMJU|nr:hypothetical protein CPB84DRAFT_1751259 [Gymnopilus junonius]
MCGLTASYTLPPQAPDAHLEVQLQDSIAAMNHRGPDSHGTYISEDGRVGLGHARLSIIDVEGGVQPLHDLEGDVHAIVNGELYDYAELRQDLEKRGCMFQTFSDSELVIHLTLFKGVFKIPAAHHLLYTRMGQLKIQPWWDHPFPDQHVPETRSVEEIIEGLRERMVDAVRARLRSDVPLAISLSGGLDSASVAGIASALLREKNPHAKVATFTLAFPARGDIDEGPVAKRMAEFVGADIHMVTPTEADLVGILDKAVYHTEHPVHTMHPSGRLILSQAIRAAGYKVTLTGEGSDEFQGGYSFLLADFLRAADPAGASLESSSFSGGTYRITRDPTKHASPQDHVSVEDVKLNDHILGKAMLVGPAPHASAGGEGEHGLWEMAPFEYWTGHLVLPWLLNEVGDRTEMGHSVEGRQPFLDHKMIEFIDNVPPSLKIRPQKTADGKWTFTEKWVLREAMKPYITEEIYLRTKSQYNSPLSNPKQNGVADGETEKALTPLQVYLKERVTKERVERLGFLNWENIEVLLDAYIQNPETPKDGGLDRKARIILSISSLTVLQDRFNVPTAVF